MTRADAGSQHAITPAGREACSLAATRHGVYAMLTYGLLPRCATCPDAVARLCPERPEAGEQSCPLLARFRAEVLAEIEPLFSGGGHLRASDRPLVIEYVKQLGLLLRIDMVLEAEGVERSVVREAGRAPGGGEAAAETEPMRMARLARHKDLIQKVRGGKGLTPSEQQELAKYEEALQPKLRPGQGYAVKSVGLDLHALIPLRETVSSKVFAYAEQLGLSPMGRKKLELTGEAAPKAVTLDAIAAEKRVEKTREEVAGG